MSYSLARVRPACVLLLVLVAGCLGGVSGEEVRDGFVENEVDAYVHEGETVVEFGITGGPTQEAVYTTESTVEYDESRLGSVFETVSDGGEERQETTTTTYLVNSTVYERTEGPLGDSGWVSFDSTDEINATWESRDSLSLYADVLEDASVEHNGSEALRGEEAHRIDVELEEARTDFLLGKFGDDRSLFEDATTDSFDKTVWITEEGHLLRAETEAEMTVHDQQTQTGEVDLDVSVTVDDVFLYDDVPEIEPPDEIESVE